MANIRDLRLRITSVGNIQKITRAMEMVATTKLRRFQGRAVAAKPYSAELEALVRGLAAAVASDPEAAGDAASLFQPGPADAPLGILFIGSDRGLCGAYNANVQRKLDEFVGTLEGKPFTLYVVGRKAMAHATRKDYPVAAYLEELDQERASFNDAANVAGMLVRDHREGKLSGAVLCSTLFRSAARYDPVIEPFLPIAPPQGSIAAEPILDPSGPDVLGRLIPRYLETSVFHMLLEAVTSEYASRRFAMKNATDAAGDMKKEITRLYNRARQAKITQEITEIVSGAEAL